jgi:hypothetical protein
MKSQLLPTLEHHLYCSAALTFVTVFHHLSTVTLSTAAQAQRWAAVLLQELSAAVAEADFGQAPLATPEQSERYLLPILLQPTLLIKTKEFFMVPIIINQ